MKKTVRIFALVMALVLVCCAFASCAKTLSGTYTTEASIAGIGGKASFTFSGSKVTLTLTASAGVLGSTTTEVKGTYEIAKATDGTQSITFTFTGENADKASSYSGTQSFAEEKDAIVIGGVKFTKAK